MSEQEVLRSTSQSIPSTFDSFMDGQLKDFDTFMTAGTKDFDSFMGQEPLVAEKPDQATIDRMRQVEESAQDKPSFLKTLGQEAIDKLGGLGETVITAGSAIPGFALSVGSGISQAARDFAAGNFDPSKVDVVSAKEEAEKKMGELIYQPKTSFGQTTTTALAAPVTAFRAGVKAGAKAITSDPQAQAAIELAGDAALAFLIPKLGKITRDTGKMVSKAIYEDSIKQVVKKGLETKHSPEVMNVIENAIREKVTPGTILEEVKRNVGTRKAEVREAVPRLTEPIVEPPGIDIRVSRDTATGDTVITVPRVAPAQAEIPPVYMTMPIEKLTDLAEYGVEGARKALAIRSKPVAESPQTPVSLPAGRPTVVPEPKIEGGGYPPTGEPSGIPEVKPTVEVLPEFTEADAKAKAEAEKKVKRDRVQGLPEKLAVSPEWKSEWDALILPALDKTKIKPEHRAEATLLLKHGFSMKKAKGTDVVKGMEHYLNTLKTRLKADERFPESQMPEVQTETGPMEIEPTIEMAKGESRPIGKNIIPEPAEVEVLAKRRERGLEAISKIVDEYEGTITDPKEKEMFRAYREGKVGRGGAREVATRGFKVRGETLDKHIKKWEADLQERGKARRDVVKKAMDEITGDEFNKATTDLADKMEKDLGPVKGPKVGLTVEMAHPIPEPPKGGEKFTFPEGTEERYDAAKHLVKPTTIQKVSDFLADAYHGMSRVYQDLPRGPEWVEVVQTLKNNEKQPGIISDKLARTYKSMYYKLNRDTYDLTARRAMLNDLLHEADAGHDLPFGFNEKSLRDVSSKLDAFIKDIAPVHEALKNRADVWDGLRKEYIYWREKAGHDVEDILNKPDYFRHKVLEVAKSEYNKVGPGKKLRLRTGQGFLKKRGGSEMDILSDLVSADYEVMSTMLRDIADAKALVKIREVADKSVQFRAEAKKQGVPIEEVIPEEYTKWQPKEGHLMYVADTLPAKIAEKIIRDELTDIGVVKDKLRKSLAIGRERETWIIKKELAATLDKLGAQKEAKVMGGVFKSALTAWKKWTLLSPRRAIKYNFRNATGDADHVFVGSPGVFLKAPQSIKELWPALFGDRPLTGNLRDWAEKGGYQSTLQIQDIGEIKKLPAYRNLYKPNVLNDINIFKKYWRFVNNATNYREGILRYAAYLKYLEDMQKDPKGKPKNFGASFPEEIMALSDIKDRAFRLSNELLGPYDEVSPVGVEISSKAYPFWRWKEVNAKFYTRIIKNIAHNDEAAFKTAKSVLGGARIAASVGTRTLIGAGRFALKAMGLTALLTAWNNLAMEDEEKDLPEDVRNRLHLVLGRDKDGKVIAFTRLGAMGDILEWFGMDNAYGHMTDYLNGRKTMKEIVTDMVKSPVNIIASGISPFIKAPLETLTRRTLFPDAFDPKVIRDRGSYLARQVGLEDEYKAIVGKPGRPYVSTLSQMAVYKYDPLESAYYDFLDIKRGYLKSIGKEGGGGPYLSPSSNALYNMKLAYRWGEHKLVNKYMEEYANIVVTQHRDATPEELKKLIVKGIRQSLTSLHPLWGIKQDDWADYVRSLDPEAKDTLAKSLRFYSEILLGKSDVKENE